MQPSDPQSEFLDRASAPPGKALVQSLTLELTERCNNDCRQCYINRPANDPIGDEELTAAEWRRLMEEAASLGCLSITLTGGEPLLRDDFWEIYLHIRRAGMMVQLATNATLITEELAKLFADIPPRSPVLITLYGATAASYEKITRLKGSFDAAVQGVRRLKALDVPFQLRGLLLSENIREKDYFQQWAQELAGTSQFIETTLLLDLRGRRDSPEKNRQIAALRMDPEMVTAVKSGNQEKYLESMRQFCGGYMAPPGEKVFSCGAGCARGTIDAYGHCQPCLLLRHPETVYDLRQGTLKEAFTAFFPLLREKPGGKEYQQRCAACFLKGLCEQCPAKSWMEHGTLDTPVEYYCQVAHRQAELLGFIKLGENAWQVTDWRQRINQFTIKEQST